jgi:hypothetical protein
MDGLIEGRIVHYVMSDQDAQEVNRRRTDGASIRDRINQDKWPIGAQAHIGNSVMAGEHFPAIVVRVWPREFGEEPGVNLQVFLDGNDSLWVTSAKFATPESIELGTCHWPEKQ